jgi:hypothetical protein
LIAVEYGQIQVIDISALNGVLESRVDVRALHAQRHN